MKTNQLQVGKLDLTKIEGNGDFPCPNCGIMISPEDETEDVYTILEEKLKGDVLEELVIQCNKCSCRIRLIGFSFLETNNL
jgi:DNA-directed RNA polymerase subunit RPC12/RpoP